MGCACGKDSCGCSAPQLVYMKDESGETHGFYVTDRLEVESRKYAFLVSAETEDQYALLRVETDAEGREYMVNISDEDEWNHLQQTLFGPMHV